jgi:stage V sporulation protein S
VVFTTPGFPAFTGNIAGITPTSQVRQELSARPSNHLRTAEERLGGSVEVLKVSSKSNPNSCAGAMAGAIRQTGAVEVQVVGAGALNQAIKAIAIARGYVAPSGIDLVCIPTFADIEIDGEGRTAIRLLIEDRTQRLPVTLDMRENRAPSLDGEARGRGDPKAASTPAAPSPSRLPRP